MTSTKVLIAFPTNGTWHSEFGMSLLTMVHKMAFVRPDIEIVVNQLTTSMLFEARFRLAKKALTEGYSHLFFVDTDQSFPPSILARLVDRDRAVVACNVAAKAEGSRETACRAREVLPDGRILVHGCNRKTGMERVWRVGTGIMLIKTSVFNDIPKPWFPAKWDPEHEMYTGEDWGFCELLEQADISIWVDHDASAKVGHWGRKEYVLDRYKEFQSDNIDSISGQHSPLPHSDGPVLIDMPGLFPESPTGRPA